MQKTVSDSAETVHLNTTQKAGKKICLIYSVNKAQKGRNDQMKNAIERNEIIVM